MKKYIASCLLFLPLLTLSQTRLTIGDKLPDWTFTPLLNAQDNIHLSQYKGKAIILCFWASTCGSSLTMIPRAADWEKQFNGSLKTIFIVDDNDPEAPAKVLDSRPSLKALNTPLMKKDTALLRLFPHTGGPHLVLIGKDRKVKAITTMEHVKSAVLTAFIKGENLYLPERKPALRREDQSSLVMDGLVENEALLFNTIVTGYNSNLPGGPMWTKLGPRHRLLIANFTLPQLCLQAYSTQIRALPFEKTKRLLFEAKGVDRETKYCYEHLMPAWAKSSAMQRLRLDLATYFNLQVTVEKRATESWIVRPLVGKAKDFDTAISYSQIWPGYMELKGATLVEIASVLNGSYEDKFFRAEGDSTSRYSVNLKLKYESEIDLKSDLAQKGFELIPVIRELDFLVVKDKPTAIRNDAH